MQDKSPGANLVELTSGILCQEGSILWNSLPTQEERDEPGGVLGAEVARLRTELRTAKQSLGDQLNLNGQLNRDLTRKNEELRSADVRVQKLESELSTQRENALRGTEAAAENESQMLRTANADLEQVRKDLVESGKKVKAQEAKTGKARSDLRSLRAELQALKEPAATFNTTLQKARLHRTGGGPLMPVDCDLDRYTSKTPGWALNDLRAIHKPFWKAYVKNMMMILGWNSEDREHRGQGGAVCTAFCLLGGFTDQGQHGCWDSHSMITALCRSPCGTSSLSGSEATARKCFQRAIKCLQPDSQKQAFAVAVEALASGASRNQRARICRALPHAAVSERKVAAEMKRLKTSVVEKTGIRPTGTDGSAALLFKSISIAFEEMPYRSNVVISALQSSCMFRAGILYVANRFKHLLRTDSVDCCLDDSESSSLSRSSHGQLKHVRLGVHAREILHAQTGFTDVQWTEHGASLFISRSDVIALLQRVLKIQDGPEISEFLLKEVVDMYLPHGTQNMLVKQLDRLLAEALILQRLPIFTTLKAALDDAEDVNYGELDPNAEGSVSERDWKILKILRTATSDEMGLKQWPPASRTTEQNDEYPDWCSPNDLSLSSAELHAANVLCRRMLSAAQGCIVGVGWDGAKMAQASLQLNLLQSAIHVSFPHLQQRLFSKSDAERKARNISSSARDDNDIPSSGGTRKKESRCGFAMYMGGQNLFPLGTAIIQKENAASIDTHITPHHSDLKNCGSWTGDHSIAPGLHFHITEAGSDALQKGQEFAAWMVSSTIGRDISTHGTCPLFTLPQEPLLKLDMKGLWEWLRVGGKSDPKKKRCPWCENPHAMQLGRGNKACLSTLSLIPGETLSQFAGRANMFLWDVLILNWEELRLDKAIDPFFDISPAETITLELGRERLTNATACPACRTGKGRCDSTCLECCEEVRTASKDLEKGNEWPMALRQKVELQMGALVLDDRSRSSDLFYQSHSRTAAMSNAEWVPVAGGWESLWPEEEKMSLLIVGADTGPREIELLRKLHLSGCAHPGCALHCRLRMIPAYWKSLHAVILSIDDREIQQQAFDRVNAYTRSANFGLQLKMGAGDEVDKNGNVIQGVPSPSGAACKWACDHLEEITRVALKGWPQSQQAKKDRLIRLAAYLRDVLEDLERGDWSPRFGTTWAIVDEGGEELDLGDVQFGQTSSDPDRILDPVLIDHLRSSYDSHERRAYVPRRLIKKFNLSARSYIVMNGYALRPISLEIDEEEERLQIQMPKRLKRLGLLWMAVHDTFGLRAGFDTYYLHDLMHHIGARWEYVRGLGFSGLGILGNSPLEKMHQSYGKWSVLHSWIVMCSRLKALTSKIVTATTVETDDDEPEEEMQEAGGAETSERAVEGPCVHKAIRRAGLNSNELARSVLGFEPLVAQMSKCLGPGMCPVCLHPRSRCEERVKNGYPCSISMQGIQGLYGRMLRSEDNDDDEAGKAGASDMYPTENHKEEKNLEDNALFEHLQSLLSKKKERDDALQHSRRETIRVKPDGPRDKKPSRVRMSTLVKRVQQIRAHQSGHNIEVNDRRIAIGRSRVRQTSSCMCTMCKKGKACAMATTCSGDCKRFSETDASTMCNGKDGADRWRCKRYEVLSWLAAPDQVQDHGARIKEWANAVSVEKGVGVAGKVKGLQTWLQKFGGIEMHRGSRNLKDFSLMVQQMLERNVQNALKIHLDKRNISATATSSTTGCAKEIESVGRGKKESNMPEEAEVSDKSPHAAAQASTPKATSANPLAMSRQPVGSDGFGATSSLSTSGGWLRDEPRERIPAVREQAAETASSADPQQREGLSEDDMDVMDVVEEQHNSDSDSVEITRTSHSMHGKTAAELEEKEEECDPCSVCGSADEDGMLVPVFGSCVSGVCLWLHSYLRLCTVTVV